MILVSIIDDMEGNIGCILSGSLHVNSDLKQCLHKYYNYSHFNFIRNKSGGVGYFRRRR